MSLFDFFIKSKKNKPRADTTSSPEIHQTQKQNSNLKIRTIDLEELTNQAQAASDILYNKQQGELKKFDYLNIDSDSINKAPISSLENHF